MATKKAGFLVQRKAGFRVTPEMKLALNHVVRELMDRGYTVLDTLWARQPGFLTFFATCYRYELSGVREFAGIKMPAPQGVVRVSFKRDGTVGVAVMGVEFDAIKFEQVETLWK